MFYSDNASYFKAADKHLKGLLDQVNFKRIQSETYNGDAAIQWKFSTPEAPWTNGVTERMVAIFKRQFKIAVQKEHLSATAIETLLVELKSVINDRPLGVSSQNPDDWSNVTPNLLIYGKSMNSISTPDLSILKNQPYADMWLTRKRVLNMFLTKWKKEYLNELSLPKKWQKHEQFILSPGAVVLLKPETLEKNTWRIGRIDSVINDHANNVKSVIVRMPFGQSLQRSVRSLALLEPDFATQEKEVLNRSLKSGTVLELGGGCLTVPAQVGQPGLDFQSPEPQRPCHLTVPVKDTDLPKDAATVTADLVSQNKTSGNCSNVAVAGQSNLRKRRHHAGYYKDLAKGRSHK
jgi:hypothetical protein